MLCIVVYDSHLDEGIGQFVNDGEVPVIVHTEPQREPIRITRIGQLFGFLLDDASRPVAPDGLHFDVFDRRF